MLVYGAIMTVALELWGGIGAFTNVIGYHHGKFFCTFIHLPRDDANAQRQ